MQRMQRAQRSMRILFAGLIVLAFSFIVSADFIAHTSPLVWSPIYARADGEVWYPPAAVTKIEGGPGGPTACAMDTAGTDGRAIVKLVWTGMYSKQTNRTTFRICGTFNGQGEVLLAYPGAGKPTDFDYTTPTTLCLDTYSGSGGDGTPRALDLYLLQLGTHAASIRSPSILVSEQP